MCSPWASLLLLSVSGSAPEPPPPPEAPPALRLASEEECREAVDFAQLSLGEWMAARRELLGELEALRRRGGGVGVEKLERWRSADADLKAEVRRIQDGLNAARARLHRGGQGGVD